MSLNFDTNVYTQLLENFKKTVTYTPVTKTISNISGQEELTTGTSSQIEITFFRQEDTILQDNEGLFQGADAVALYKTSITLNLNDTITYDGQVYRVEKQPTTRRLGGTEFYKVARLFKIGTS